MFCWSHWDFHVLLKQASRQADNQASKQAGMQSSRQAYKQTHKQTHKQTEKQAGKQVGGQTSRQADRQTSRQSSKHADNQTDNQTSRQADNQTSRQSDKQASRQAGKQPSTQRSKNLFFLRKAVTKLWLELTRANVPASGPLWSTSQQQCDKQRCDCAALRHSCTLELENKTKDHRPQTTDEFQHVSSLDEQTKHKISCSMCWLQRCHLGGKMAKQLQLQSFTVGPILMFFCKEQNTMID